MPSLRCIFLSCLVSMGVVEAFAADPAAPVGPPNWTVEVVAAYPQIRYPSTIACSPDGRLFIGEDSLDMEGPRDQPINRVVCLHPDGRITEFATNLFCVFGLLYLDGKLYVNHAPKLSVYDDAGDAGRNRQDWFDYTSPRADGTLLTGSGSHIPANLRLGMDGFIYMAVGDVGIYGMTDRSGKKLELRGGGVVRFRPDGKGAEVFASGTRNHPDIALNSEDECFTYDNTDDGLGWWTRVTHLVDGGFYGYPWDYKPRRPHTLWMMLDYGAGSGTCALAYNEDALPAEYQGNIFFGEFARQQLLRLKFRPDGSSYTVDERVQVGGRDFLSAGASEFRPTGIAMAPDGAGFYVADWASNFAGVRAPIGRILKVNYAGPRQGQARPAWWVPAATGKQFDADIKALANGLKHPAQSVRLVAQRRLAERGADGRSAALGLLTNRTERSTTRAAALWMLDAQDGGQLARPTILSMLEDPDPALRSQVLRHLGIRSVREAATAVSARLKDPEIKVRFQAATTLGRLGEVAAVPALIDGMAEMDFFTRYATFTALNRIGRSQPSAWSTIAGALKSPDTRVREGALFALRETWELPLVEALVAAFKAGGLDVTTRVAVIEVISDLARKEPPWDGTWWNTGGNPAGRSRPARTRDWEGTATAMSAVRDALREKESGVRSVALSAARQLKDTNAAPVLRELLRGQTDASQSKELLASLAEIGGNAFVEELRQLVNGAVQGKPSPGLETLLPAALDAVRDPASSAQLLRLAQSTVRPEWRTRAIAALGRVADRSSVTGVKSLLTDKDAGVVSAAIEALPRMDSETLVREAARLLKDPRIEVRRALVRALASAPDPTALEPLKDAIGDLTIRDDVVKVFAVRPDMPAFDVYVAGLSSKDPATVDAAVNALLVIQGEAWLRLESPSLLQSIPPQVLQRLAGGSRNRPFNQMMILGPVEDGLHDFNELVQAAAANRPYGGPAMWQQAQAKPLSGRIPLRESLKLVRPNPRQVAFALLPLNVPNGQQIILSVEADDLRGVMLNGQDVMGTMYPAENGPRKFREFATSLVAGQNLLLVTVGLGEASPLLALSWTLNAPLRQAADVSPEAYAGFATSMAGSEKAGESVFHNSRKAACARCHRVGSLGGGPGPALDGVGSKLSRPQLIEAVLYPSKQILHGFQQVTIARKNGESASGLLVRDDAEFVSLVDSAGATNAIKASEVASRKASEVSLMPEGMHVGLTPQEFADLISYLQGLK